jgi:uncharacterized protein YlxP (DUF503 family)
MRLSQRFELNDTWKNAVIGVACVSNEASHTDSMMANIVKFVENDGKLSSLTIARKIFL